MGKLGETLRAETEWERHPSGSSVVQVPGKAKPECDECPKIQALRTRLKQKYGDTFFSGKLVFPTPLRGPYGEAQIGLKPDPLV